MKGPDEIYAEYLAWCVANKLPPLNPLQYEKVLRSIPSTPNNTDAILRNNNQRKDKNGSN